MLSPKMTPEISSWVSMIEVYLPYLLRK
jgi:hypothetical protein